MDLNNPNCDICKKNDNYLIKNTCCNIVKYCLPCMKNVEDIYNIPENNTDGKIIRKTKIPKCPNCKKKLKYEQNYIENPYVKPVEHLQTLILSHNLNILHYIYNKIVCKNIASVGYYVGGMKEQELKNSETKQIILASFSMASEALDIPSLNAEFLITPKTDVIQSVGRVLRAKHKFANPIIYDIKDTHLVFEKQWLKRKAYFKKQNYNIIECDSYNYNTNYCNWKNSNKQTLSTNTNLDDLDDDLDEDNTTNKDKLSKGVCFLKLKK
jgi:superfamily II DNA or RNA helicase